ncbi:MAG TPA: hypothetical protein VJU86_06130 [Pyrinomonadaceae bacterium]|nr:hypothetical protein [Pyrinomonadaceae bacterium]
MTQMVSGEITSYTARIYSKTSDERAFIYLYSPPSSTGCYLKFYNEAAVIPENRLVLRDDGSKQLYISQRYSDYFNILDLVRNEKPVRFFYRDDVKLFYVNSGDEPVGEHELSV